MAIQTELEQWFFNGPGKGLYFNDRKIVRLDTTQPQGAIQWEVGMYSKDTDQIATCTFYTGEDYRDVDADSITDIDLLNKIYDACCEYSGVSDYNMWIQETYPGWELYRACKDDAERNRLKNFYQWARTTYENAQRVMGEEAFETFYNMNN